MTLAGLIVEHAHSINLNWLLIIASRSYLSRASFSSSFTVMEMRLMRMPFINQIAHCERKFLQSHSHYFFYLSFLPFPRWTINHHSFWRVYVRGENYEIAINFQQHREEFFFFFFSAISRSISECNYDKNELEGIFSNAPQRLRHKNVCA